jgi:hypothetical protein
MVITFSGQGHALVADVMRDAENADRIDNRKTIYEYDDDNALPDICFFPAQKARWDGNEVLIQDWEKLTYPQKTAFVNEGIKEIERKTGAKTYCDDRGRLVDAVGRSIEQLRLTSGGAYDKEKVIQLVESILSENGMMSNK